MYFCRFLEELRERQKETEKCLIKGIADIVLEYVRSHDMYIEQYIIICVY